jgi:hypothetical protein
MPSTRDEPAGVPPDSPESSLWPKIVVRVPPSWKVWLEEAAEARALTVAALVRQCIRALMITRHEGE